MPYSVQDLLEGRGQPISVSPVDKLEKALEKMIENDFSQLPVIDEDQRPLGIITYESMLRAMINFNVSIDQLRVGDSIAKAPCYHAEDPLFDLLDRLRDTNTALIINREGILTGIVTSYDSTEYFRRRAEDMMLVEDIETMIKELLLSKYVDNEGGIDQTKIKTAIENITGASEDSIKKFKRALIDYMSSDSAAKTVLDPDRLKHSIEIYSKVDEVKEFDKLTLNEYIAILLHPKHWNDYKTILNIDSQALKRVLDSVRDTRNDLAHFRNDITPVKRASLKFTSDWLELQRTIQPKWHINGKSDTETTIDTSLVIKNSSNSTPDNSELREILPTEELIKPEDSRYAQLAVWLNSQPGNMDRVQLTFEEIATIIDGDLPPSASRHRAWWANDPVGHSHSQNWLDSGWRTTNVNLNESKVTFARIADREKAYIHFFGDLLVKLQKSPPFRVKTISPDGSSWIVVYGIPENRQQCAVYSYSFALRKRFRVELYIDSGYQVTNKKIFDDLYSKRNDIETKFGQTLSWERINDRRASRIAVYREGSIEDSTSDLHQVRDWAVTTMVNFYKAINPLAIDVIEKTITG